MQRGAGRGRGAGGVLLPRRRSLLVAAPRPPRRPPVSRAPPTRSLFQPPAADHPPAAQRSMHQQMPLPSSAHAGEVVNLVRTIEGRSCDATAEDYHQLLRQSRRNYSCTKCAYHTRNSRDYLLHARDVHFEKFKIYVCSLCDYASRHRQKLVRHNKVHDSKPTGRMTSESNSMPEKNENMEEFLEEVEECDDDEDDEMFIEECTEDADVNGSRTSSHLLPKDKSKYFSCTKCNYVTHIRGRFTKHVKYHSMPMIKCHICDFRTPYKWNLDRHNKNHGGTGSFLCTLCNFTADIKQSLTVHEMNHHSPASGQSGASRRRNRVGASDTALTAAATAAAAAAAAAPTRVPKEEEGSGDSQSSHSASDMGLQFTEKEMVSCNSDSNDATIPDAGAKRDDSNLAPDAKSQQSPGVVIDDGKSPKQNRKIPRPPPPLIPINPATPNQSKTPNGEPPAKKIKEDVAADSSDTTSYQKFENLPADITLIPVHNSTPHTEETARKKNESFFDKLKKRLLTETGKEGSLICKNCNFESKCLSEHSVHEKNCAALNNRTSTSSSGSSLGSTRCQNCRHRCKSSADLYIHMQTCKRNETIVGNSSTKVQSQQSNETTIICNEKEAPHPMENVVFVWNNINQAPTKFDLPLDISINDDSTLPTIQKCYESEIIEEPDNMNLSPSQAGGKNVFKCPHCAFWATTASRFHVHIVGHLNKKPFECSLCKYKSNWRWDITKHIKLKSARDPDHNEAKVLMTDETGRRNYTKYNRFLAMPMLNEYGENEFHYIDPNTAADASMEIDETCDINESASNSEMQPLNLQTQQSEYNSDMFNRTDDFKKPKKTLWKCKKCNYKDPSKEALLEHVREHARNDEKKKIDSIPAPDPSDLAYRCGHCNQLSNWKHVIQRHCRLKHDGIIKVITTLKPKLDILTASEPCGDSCNKCPFKSSDKNAMATHMQQHTPSLDSVFKCYFCPYFVKDDQDLVTHLLVHGVTEPEEYINTAMGNKFPLPEHLQPTVPTSSSTKRHKCTDCPYETNSKSQYMYHEQFHRLPADTPYKCPECNYSVSKRHLLHQHLRVHGIFTKKGELEAELEAAATTSKPEVKTEYPLLEEIPFVWVSAKNEFHKMYKCRYCSYVNSQKCKIPNHEKIHCIVFENTEITVYKCLECKYTCDNAGRLAEHSKTHGEIYGRIYCPVEDDVPDEEQIAKLRKVVENEKLTAEESPKEEMAHETKELKIVHFCHKCPARFFTDSELKIHDKFHDLAFDHKCKSCEFSTNQETELAAHTFVHSDEYNTKTKMLKFMHVTHPAHKEPQLELVHCPTTSEITWIVSSPSKNFEEGNRKSTESRHVPRQYSCKECPAKFFKSSALSYHMGLHGGEGDHKCKKCSYTVKNIGNLAKHELLHETESKVSNCDYDSENDMDFKNVPLSGTDLFQRKTEAQKRVLTDKDKLVKPNDHFPPVLQADPQFGYLMHGNPEFIYPTYLKNGRQKEKRYKCHKCPSAFEKREQYKIHLSLHGSKQRYKCELCDYSVKYYANYVQHMRKHQMNDEAQAERKKETNDFGENDSQEEKHDDSTDNIKLAIKTMPKGAAKSDFQQFSVSDQQTLRLLQRRRSINATKESSPSEISPTKDRKLHMCLLCPYTNQRQDALLNHYRRHDDNDALSSSNHKCSYCDLAVVQSHFLRDHIKTHFSYQKNQIPECFVANQDVSFTISKVDEEDVATDLTLDLKSNTYTCNDDKIFVRIKTGELMVE